MTIIFSQWIAGVGATMLLVQVGFMNGWTSPTFAKLTAPDSPIPLNSDQASWVASLITFTRFFGCILGTISTGYLGSKQSIFLTLFPICIGWIVVAYANAVEWLYVARLSSGLGAGMALTVFPLYIGEVAMTEIRGSLVSLATCGAPVGQVVVSICSSYLPVGGASSIYLALAVLLMGLFFWLPESPHHLAKIGKHEAAKKSISWYRSGRDVDTELEAVENFVTSNVTNSFYDKLSYFKTRPIRRATIQATILFGFSQICGLNSVVFYMETILTRGKFTLFRPSSLVIYANIGAVFASAASITLIDKCGRKFLLLISSGGTAIAMIGLMIHFSMMDDHSNIARTQWLPMCSLFLVMIAYCIGLNPVPSAILSETFPTNIKCTAACIASLTGAISAFISVKTYQPIVDAIGETYVFLIYAVLSVSVIPYTLYCVTETKGKSLQQIQDEFNKT